VTPAAFIAFAAATAFGVGDWIAKVRHDRRLEYFCKPATLGALIAAACALDPAADAQTQRAWFVVGLMCSLAGDVFLMLDDERRNLFVAGLAAFLLAHLTYIAGFWTDGPAGRAFAVAAIVVAVVLGPVAVRILSGLRREPALRGPVACYVAVISAMVATALATGNVPAAAGAALFAASDSMIAWNRFVAALEADVPIMVTYHLGQAGLVLSLLG
jgi:uncharacterized membrane protein YhhN